jgi:hypothetical protein
MEGSEYLKNKMKVLGYGNNKLKTDSNSVTTLGGRSRLKKEDRAYGWKQENDKGKNDKIFKTVRKFGMHDILE